MQFVWVICQITVAGGAEEGRTAVVDYELWYL